MSSTIASVPGPRPRHVPAPPESRAPAPIKLARHPDYHAGRIAFSYLGDLWVANDDGTGARSRDRSHGARHLSALLAGRPLDRVLVESLRQQRRVRDSRRRRRREAAHVPQRQRRCGGLDRATARAWCSAPPRPWRVPERRHTARSRSTGDRNNPLPTDWGYSGSFSPDGKSLVFNRHPVDLVAPPLSRQLRRRLLDHQPRRQELYAAARR